MSLHCRRKWKRGHLRWIWIQGPQKFRHVRKQKWEFPTTCTCGWVPLLTSYTKMSKQEVRPKSGMVKAFSVSISQPVFTHGSNSQSEPKWTSCPCHCCHDSRRSRNGRHYSCKTIKSTPVCQTKKNTSRSPEGLDSSELPCSLNRLRRQKQYFNLNWMSSKHWIVWDHL